MGLIYVFSHRQNNEALMKITFSHLDFSSQVKYKMQNK